MHAYMIHSAAGNKGVIDWQGQTHRLLGVPTYYHYYYYAPVFEIPFYMIWCIRHIICMYQTCSLFLRHSVRRSLQRKETFFMCRELQKKTSIEGQKIVSALSFLLPPGFRAFKREKGDLERKKLLQFTKRIKEIFEGRAILTNLLIHIHIYWSLGWVLCAAWSRLSSFFPRSDIWNMPYLGNFCPSARLFVRPFVCLFSGGTLSFPGSFVSIQTKRYLTTKVIYAVLHGFIRTYRYKQTAGTKLSVSFFSFAPKKTNSMSAKKVKRKFFSDWIWDFFLSLQLLFIETFDSFFLSLSFFHSFFAAGGEIVSGEIISFRALQRIQNRGMRCRRY